MDVVSQKWNKQGSCMEEGLLFDIACSNLQLMTAALVSKVSVFRFIDFMYVSTL